MSIVDIPKCTYAWVVPDAGVANNCARDKYKYDRASSDGSGELLVEVFGNPDERLRRGRLGV